MRLKSAMNLTEIQTDTLGRCCKRAHCRVVYCKFVFIYIYIILINIIMMYIMCSRKDKHVANASKCLSRNCIESPKSVDGYKMLYPLMGPIDPCRPGYIGLPPSYNFIHVFQTCKTHDGAKEKH